MDGLKPAGSASVFTAGRLLNLGSGSTTISIFGFLLQEVRSCQRHDLSTFGARLFASGIFRRWLNKGRRDSRVCFAAGTAYHEACCTTARRWALDCRQSFMVLSGSTFSPPAVLDVAKKREVQRSFCAHLDFSEDARPKPSLKHLLWECKGLADDRQATLCGACPASALPCPACPAPALPCPLPFALCPLPFALCPLPFALCPLPFALCPALPCPALPALPCPALPFTLPVLPCPALPCRGESLPCPALLLAAALPCVPLPCLLALALPPALRCPGFTCEVKEDAMK